MGNEPKSLACATKLGEECWKENINRRMFNKVKHSSVSGLRFDWRDCPMEVGNPRGESDGSASGSQLLCVVLASYVRNKFGVFDRVCRISWNILDAVTERKLLRDARKTHGAVRGSISAKLYANGSLVGL